LIRYEAVKNGQPSTIIRTTNGIRNSRWPSRSIQSRTRLGNRPFTMSMRMCSFLRKV
jgi:hypothetical protein